MVRTTHERVEFTRLRVVLLGGSGLPLKYLKVNGKKSRVSDVEQRDYNPKREEWTRPHLGDRAPFEVRRSHQSMS